MASLVVLLIVLQLDNLSAFVSHMHGSIISVFVLLVDHSFRMLLSMPGEIVHTINWVSIYYSTLYIYRIN